MLIVFRTVLMDKEIRMNIKINGKEYQPQRIFCIGRNYAMHVEEMDNDMPDSPIVFSIIDSTKI
mgnify:CR=1 FL=1